MPVKNNTTTTALTTTADLATVATLADLALQGSIGTDNKGLIALIAIGQEEYSQLGWVGKNFLSREVKKALTGKAKGEVFGPYGSNKKFEYNKLDVRGSLQAILFLKELDADLGTDEAVIHLNFAKEICTLLYALSGKLKDDAKKAEEVCKKDIQALNKAFKAFNPDHKVKGHSDVSSLSSLSKVMAKKAKASVGIKEDNEEGTNMVSKGSAWASAKVVCGKDNRIVHNKEAKVFLVTKYVVPGTSWYKAIDSQAIPADIDCEVMEAIIEEFKYE